MHLYIPFLISFSLFTFLFRTPVLVKAHYWNKRRSRRMLRSRRWRRRIFKNKKINKWKLNEKQNYTAWKQAKRKQINDDESKFCKLFSGCTLQKFLFREFQILKYIKKKLRMAFEIILAWKFNSKTRFNKLFGAFSISKIS